MILVFIVSATVVPGVLYLIWRMKYRYPPADIPQVLCYHKISRAPLLEGTWTTPDRFFAQIDHLVEAGYRFIDEPAYLACLQAGGFGGPAVGETVGGNPGEVAAGEPGLGWVSDPSDRRPGDGPGKQLFLTFDDGYAQIFSLVYPGLRDRGVPAHIFLVTDYAGRDNSWDLSLGRPPSRHLDWSEVREMAENGYSFGSHGASHRDLTRLSEEVCLDELRRSKAAIEDQLGRPVRSFSYPFGRNTARLGRLVRAVGYEAAFSLYPAHANERLDRYALRRNGIYVIDTPRTIKLKLERHPFSWLEEMKCRAINRVAALTPVLKSFSESRDS